MHGARPGHAALCRRRIERDRAAPPGPAQLPRGRVHAGRAEHGLEQGAAALEAGSVCAHAVEALERQLARDLRVVRDARLVRHVRHDQLVLEALGVVEPQRAVAPLGARLLARQALGPEVQRRGAAHPPLHPIHHARARAAARGAAVLEERDIRAGMSVLI